MRVRIMLGVATLALALAGCRRDAGDASRASPGVVRQQGGAASPRGAAGVARLTRPMADRHEAQELLDRAAELAASPDPRLAPALLHRAAAFFQVQANTPRSGGSGELLAAAESLDAMAGRISHGVRVGERDLRTVSARANLAEAERHGALAAAAWSTHSKESVADELLMAADHVERAAADAHLALSPAMRRLLVEIRRLAPTLAAGPGVDVQALDEPLAELHLEVLAMRRALEARDGGAAAAASPKP